MIIVSAIQCVLLTILPIYAFVRLYKNKARHYCSVLLEITTGTECPSTNCQINKMHVSL